MVRLKLEGRVTKERLRHLLENEMTRGAEVLATCTNYKSLLETATDKLEEQAKTIGTLAAENEKLNKWFKEERVISDKLRKDLDAWYLRGQEWESRLAAMAADREAYRGRLNRALGWIAHAEGHGPEGPAMDAGQAPYDCGGRMQAADDYMDRRGR